jgi:3'-5' exonuclease
MNYLYLDIETIPSQSQQVKEDIYASISPPGNIKKPESIAAWMKENAEQAAEEKWLKTSFDGSRGEVVCISWALNLSEVRTRFRSQGESERGLLENFYVAVNESLISEGIGMMQRVIHGSKDLFDLRFLFQRSVVLSCKPSFDLRQDTRYNGEHVYDTMTAWAGWGNYVSLDAVCKALGVESPKTDMTGADVWPEFQKGNIKKIADYNRADVEALRNVHRRMMFL